MALDKSGYVGIMQGLSVQSGRTAEINITMIRQTGSMIITSTPAGADISMDGVAKGNAVAGGLKLDKILVCSYKLKAELAKYYSDEKTVDINYNQEIKVNFNLRAKPGSVFVISTPNGADIYLDDKKQTGKTPFKVNEVTTGAHKVKAYLDGYQTEEKSVTVEAEKTATGSLPGMTFRKIPGGSFQMGSNDGAGYKKPVHRVTISPFYMMTTEVTQAQWQAVMGSNPSYFKGDNLPVEQVFWEDVKDFIEKLNQKDPGKGYRLPSEAEWEYACRAVTTTNYYSGDSESDLGRAGWYYGNSGRETHPVGQKSPNNWGLYDMHGNVWEWCEDYWHDNYSGAPTNGSAWLSPSSSSLVLRGGFWVNYDYGCRSANRVNDNPSVRYNNCGFRLVRSS